MAISGGGGGGGGGGKGGSKKSQRTPTEAENSLFSTAYAEVVDLLGEGEIGGLVDGDRSIFLNNTPLQSANGSYNFKNVTVETRNGTQGQDYIPGFDDISSEVAVGVTVTNPLPVVQTITSTAVNAVRVTISIPGLQEIKDNGDIKGSKITLAISVQYNGGGYTAVINDTISGRTSQQYQKQYLVNLSGAFPVNIMVTRQTPDSGSAKKTNAFNWQSYTEIVYAKAAYPNSALVAIRIDAEQFNSIPTRSYRVKGLKVRVPWPALVNQATGAIAYTAIWDGVFKAAEWTSDPAWCLYDLLTSKRYGFGQYIDENSLDRWAFFAASQYCNELVPDGFGGMEPRFSCNVNIQTEQDAYSLINSMCSVFRAMPFWSAGALTVSQDKPATPAYLFTYANVSEEAGFSYSGSNLRTRATVAVVQYFDLDARDTAYEVVEDAEGIKSYGVSKVEVSAFACTSRGQAARVGQWLLYSAQNERETITFTTSFDSGVIVRPGSIIEVSDPVRAGARRGGRIKNSTASVVQVDDASGLTATSATLSVVLSTGLVEARGVSSISGNAITVSSAFSSAPNGNSIWVLETPTLQATTWRVISVVEQDQVQYQITALEYNASKYSAIENGTKLQTRSISSLNAIPDPPTNLTLIEKNYTYTDQVRSKVIATWQGVPGIGQYLLQWRVDEGNWTSVTRLQPDYEVLNITPGVFEFNVYSTNSGGQSSVTAASGTLTTVGKLAPPSNVTNFTATLEPDGVVLSWDQVPDPDINFYQIYQEVGQNPGTKLGDFFGTYLRIGIPAVGTTTWYIVAVDTSFVASVTGAAASLTIGGAAAPAAMSGVIDAGVLVLSWSPAVGGLRTASYELRYGSATDTWETATTLANVGGTTYSLPVTWGGARRFFVAAISVGGSRGDVATWDSSITPPGRPVITAQVIDNNVLLTWADVTRTLPISTYELRKGGTWETAVAIGNKSGLFTSTFETVSGTYTYWLAGLDTAGNVGEPSSVSAQVNQPVDYVLGESRNSSFLGSKTNMVTTDDGFLVGNVNTTETWEAHFSSRSWTTLQAQATANYPILVMPSLPTGQYVEEIDYGALLPAFQISTTLTSNAIAGTTAATPTIYTRGTTTTAATYTRAGTTVTVNSTAHGLTAGRLVFVNFATGGAVSGSYLVLATGLTANAFTITTAATGTSGNATWIAWTTYPGVASALASNFRYARIQYNLTGAADRDLLRLTALNITLDAKIRNDSGNGTAASTDAGGTVVSFSYAFIDVESITVTPTATTPVIAVYDFVDTPNPTTFKVLLFNTTGARVSGNFSWSARGF